MLFAVHFPEKKRFDKFKAMIKELKNLTGMSYHRILETAVVEMLLKKRKINL